MATRKVCLAMVCLCAAMVQTGAPKFPVEHEDDNDKFYSIVISREILCDLHDNDDDVVVTQKTQRACACVDER